jgi:hypothetical protein
MASKGKRGGLGCSKKRLMNCKGSDGCKWVVAKGCRNKLSKKKSASKAKSPKKSMKKRKSPSKGLKKMLKSPKKSMKKRKSPSKGLKKMFKSPKKSKNAMLIPKFMKM